MDTPHETQKSQAWLRLYSLWGAIGIACGAGLSLFLLLFVFDLPRRSPIPPLLILSLAALPGVLDVHTHLARLARVIRKTPTTPIGTARLGYVELVGRAAANGRLLESPQSGVACVWHRIEDAGSKRITAVDSNSPFLLRDASGECLIDVDGATVYGTRAAARSFWGHGYDEYVIREGDPVYAIGELYFVKRSDAPRVRDAAAIRAATEGAKLDSAMDRAMMLNFADEIARDATPDEPAPRRPVVDVLGKWQQDPAAFAQRFDTNRDGRVDMKEMLAARLKASEMEQAQAGAKPKPPPDTLTTMRVLARPRNPSLPFLVMNRPVAEVERYLRVRIWAMRLAAAAFAGMAGGAIYWAAITSR